MTDDADEHVLPAVRRWIEVDDRQAAAAAMERIFFASSATQSFVDEGEKARFRERWLGRYLENYPEWVYLAYAPDGVVVGYLLGSLDDPALNPLFADIGYFSEIAAWTAEFPAQLHVNIDPDWRSQGLGAFLVASFQMDAMIAGARGVHVVTARGLRNIGFYMRCGFREITSFAWQGRELVMLGRSLTRST